MYAATTFYGARHTTFWAFHNEVGIVWVILVVGDRAVKAAFGTLQIRRHNCQFKGGSFQSPTLAPGEGWHQHFPFPGEFSFGLKERPGAKGVVTVVRD